VKETGIWQMFGGPGKQQTLLIEGIFQSFEKEARV
jgi:hypothetical protein